MHRKNRIAILGAGMGGTLMAIILARKGYTVDLFEKRQDIRTIPPLSNRTITQSISIRGIRILQSLGLWERLETITIVEKGRTVHTKSGQIFFSPYCSKNQYVHNTFNRNIFNSALLDIASEQPGIRIHFSTRGLEIDKTKKTVTVQDGRTGQKTVLNAEIVIGADGVNSMVRKSFEDTKTTTTKRIYLDGGYKDFFLPATHPVSKALSKETFHMWPRDNCFLFTIPNKDGSFVFTIILSEADLHNFLGKKPEQLQIVFEKNFPDIASLASLFAKGIRENRLGRMECLYTSAWHDGNFAVLLGDSCHAVMPFYGQGISATLEDCAALLRLMDAYPGNWGKIFPAYQVERKRNTDILTDLSTVRYLELKDGFRSKRYLAKERIEAAFSRRFPSAWMPLYTLITHTSIPYADAYMRYRRQQKIGKLLGLDLWTSLYSLILKTEAKTETS